MRTEGLFGPGSVTWRVNRERVVLLGGPAAAVLQVAHPVVARGVAAHSRYREDAVGRLSRTLGAVYTVAFGSRDEVERVRREVGRAHARVRGEGYSAFDPGAQLWVLATLIHGSVSLFERYVGRLSGSEKDRLIEENRAFGGVFGLDAGLIWRSWREFEEYWQSMVHGDELGSDPLCAEVTHSVLHPGSPGVFAAMAPVLLALAREWIPEKLRDRLKIRRGMLGTIPVLDVTLPRLIPVLPSVVRFAPHYRRAKTRMEGDGPEKTGESGRDCG
ncbi:MAG: oxygenase MpaB family protein [Terrimicrobiaceae bacterium]